MDEKELKERYQQYCVWINEVANKIDSRSKPVCFEEYVSNLRRWEDNIRKRNEKDK